MLNGEQFHTMNRESFEALPNTWFHGTPSGVVGSGDRPIHVGTRRAATEALGARMNMGNPGEWPGAYEKAIADSRKAERSGKAQYSTGDPIIAPDPQVVGGRVVGPMVNGRYNAYDDYKANAIASRYYKRGNMRQGIWYKNIAEDEGSHSAVLPRSSFKTHEDYLVEAHARGEHIPDVALKGYDQIPGQLKLF